MRRACMFVFSVLLLFPNGFKSPQSKPDDEKQTAQEPKKPFSITESFQPQQRQTRAVSARSHLAGFLTVERHNRAGFGGGAVDPHGEQPLLSPAVGILHRPNPPAVILDN